MRPSHLMLSHHRLESRRRHHKGNGCSINCQWAFGHQRRGWRWPPDHHYTCHTIWYIIVARHHVLYRFLAILKLIKKKSSKTRNRMLLNLTVNTIQVEKMTAMTPLFYPSATELHRPHNSPGLRSGCDDFIMFAPMVLHSYLLPFDPRHAVWSKHVSFGVQETDIFWVKTSCKISTLSRSFWDKWVSWRLVYKSIILLPSSLFSSLTSLFPNLSFSLPASSCSICWLVDVAYIRNTSAHACVHFIYTENACMH